MTQETDPKQLPDWMLPQRERDQTFIRENLDVFWAAANAAYEMGGRGAVMVNAMTWKPEEPPPPEVAFGYLGQLTIEKNGDEDMKRMVAAYDPDRELVMILLKADHQASTYRVQVKIKDPLLPKVLLDAETRARLPALYSGEALGIEALALVKFFTPDSNWTWYASEFDGQDTFYGLVSGHAVEYGYFSLSELEEVQGPSGLPIERDQHFEPKPLSELEQRHKQQRKS